MECDYRPVAGDPAIRVCAAHDPELGLYGGEFCAGEAVTVDGAHMAHVADALQLADRALDAGEACDRAAAMLRASVALQDAADRYGRREMSPRAFRSAVRGHAAR
jgi:hypothetical protein